MRLALVFAIFTTGFCFAADAKDEAVKKGLEKLQGTWTLVSIEEDGKKQPFPEGGKMQVVFKDNKMTARTTVGDKTDSKEATYSIDPSKKPAHLDITPTDGPGKGKVVPHIYVIEKDELKLCGATEGSQERPKDFATKKGEKAVLLIFKREKQ
jgi:uncharacterized protein (TIGR03067 family)